MTNNRQKFGFENQAQVLIIIKLIEKEIYLLLSNLEEFVNFFIYQ